jgi:DNA-binding MurR/RpiR family transcriptional regulator
LTGVDDDALAMLVERLADLERAVAVVSSDASAGVALQFQSQLHQLRPDVGLIRGSDVEIRRDLAVLDVGATVILIDIRRYERWVLEAQKVISARGIWSAGVTDSMLSPIAAASDVAFVVGAGSIGPFDSYVGVLALLDLVALDVASRLKGSATQRLAAIEAAWSAHGTLIAPD